MALQVVAGEIEIEKMRSMSGGGLDRSRDSDEAECISFDHNWDKEVQANPVDSVIIVDEESIVHNITEINPSRDSSISTVTLPLELSGGARDYSSSSSGSDDEPKCTHEDRKAPLDCEFLNIECQFGKYFSEIQSRARESGLDITPKNKKSMKKSINLRRDEHVEMFTKSKDFHGKVPCIQQNRIY